MNCDVCSSDAAWIVYSSYDVDLEAMHPTLARYPQPMIRACSGHLSILLSRDNRFPMSTAQWVIKAT